MDLRLPSPLSLFLIATPLLLILIKHALWPTKHGARLPPGPKPLPIIGNLHNLTGQPPHRALRRLANMYGAIMRLRLGQVDCVVVTSPEVAREITKTHDLIFSDRPRLYVGETIGYKYSDIVLSPYGEYWRQLRKITALHLLSAKRVTSFACHRQDEIQKLVRDIAANGSVNLSAKVTPLSNAIVARSAFGKECEHSQRFISAMTAALELSRGFCLADLFPSLRFMGVLTGMKFRAYSVFRNTDEILEQIVAEHIEKKIPKKTEDDEDLVDVLLTIMDSGTLQFPFTKDNIKAVIVDMFVAGTDTSSNVVEWTMAELMKNPKCMARVQAEIRQALGGKTRIEEIDLQRLHYLKLVIKETMRLHPPLPLLLPRQSIKTCDVGGYKLDAGTRVIINAWALARDPKFWKDPECFDPDRFDGSSIEFMGNNFEFIPFGAGRRSCPGMAFGMATVELTLAYLLLCFNWELPAGVKPKELDMTEKQSVSVRKKSDLHLIATPYAP